MVGKDRRVAAEGAGEGAGEVGADFHVGVGEESGEVLEEGGVFLGELADAPEAVEAAEEGWQQSEALADLDEDGDEDEDEEEEDNDERSTWGHKLPPLSVHKLRPYSPQLKPK